MQAGRKQEGRYTLCYSMKGMNQTCKRWGGLYISRPDNMDKDMDKMDKCFINLERPSSPHLEQVTNTLTAKWKQILYSVKWKLCSVLKLCTCTRLLRPDGRGDIHGFVSNSLGNNTPTKTITTDPWLAMTGDKKEGKHYQTLLDLPRSHGTVSARQKTVLKDGAVDFLSHVTGAT